MREGWWLDNLCPNRSPKEGNKHPEFSLLPGSAPPLFPDIAGRAWAQDEAQAMPPRRAAS